MTGLYGQGNGGIGVFGRSTTNTGVFGLSDSGYGVHGESTRNLGVHGRSFNSTGVFGLSTFGYGAHGESTYSLGVHGRSTTNTGVFGLSTDSIGVHGKSIGNYGVLGEGRSGVIGRGSDWGVWGKATTAGGYAGYFDGGVLVLGDLTVLNGNKPFKIDHPVEPQNKYLLHNAVESSERKNVYDGGVLLDEDGAASVDLPVWFEALNEDFRYQLTAVGGAAPNLHVAEEIYENRFKIAGGEGGMKVCWQVTGSRKDPWAAANPFEVEEEKSPEDRGRYLQPGLYNAPEEQRVRIGPMEVEVHEPPPQAPQMPPSFVLDLYEENRQQVNESRQQIDELRRQIEELRRKR